MQSSDMAGLLKTLRPHLLLSTLHSDRTRIELLADLDIAIDNAQSNVGQARGGSDAGQEDADVTAGETAPAMVERMGEALFALSDSLRESLGNDHLHARYEAAVAAFDALASQVSIEASHHAAALELLLSTRSEIDEQLAVGFNAGSFELLVEELDRFLAKIGGGQ